ncbi:MAG: glycerophosphodiester phosphodiesterase [Proteobacteria bacterium]|nr:glycerophosphodiester phosphodiesterase [Pseudomonadota bacterium]
MSRPYLLQGHRGARGLFPENTVEGFVRAMMLGVRSFELDVGVTADGVVVCHHDLALNPEIARGPDGRWIAGPPPTIRSLSLEELRRFDVGRIRPGSAYAARFPDQRPIDGTHIPTLAEVLAATAGASLNIELKTDPTRPGDTVDGVAMAEAVLAVVDAAGAAERVMVESFDWRGPRHVLRTRPGIRVALLTEPRTCRAARLWWDGPAPEDYGGTGGGSVPRAVAAEGAAAWAAEYAALTAAEVAEAHALGLRVLPWTVNEPEAMARLLAWGADGLITDRPDLAPPPR